MNLPASFDSWKQTPPTDCGPKCDNGLLCEQAREEAREKVHVTEAACAGVIARLLDLDPESNHDSPGEAWRRLWEAIRERVEDDANDRIHYGD